MNPTNLADTKAWNAMVTEDGATIVFGSGLGDGGDMPLVQETEQGNVLFVLAYPPEWASERLLAAFSARATAATTGSCPLCSAVGAVGRVDGVDSDHLYSSTYNHDEECDASTDQLVALYQSERPQPMKAGRNDPCPCGSGEKFKRCHGR
jgi:hypothetical protein